MPAQGIGLLAYRIEELDKLETWCNWEGNVVWPEKLCAELFYIIEH